MQVIDVHTHMFTDKFMALLKRIWYDCITYHPGALQFLISVVGADRVLFGTDYPHQVHDMKGSMANTAVLPAEVRQAIREDNARQIFRI
jgi:aminocarboxymuconate-semialdehyde decarboxylase